jgi:hypothetical protein
VHTITLTQARGWVPHSTSLQLTAAHGAQAHRAAQGDMPGLRRACSDAPRPGHGAARGRPQQRRGHGGRLHAAQRRRRPPAALVAPTLPWQPCIWSTLQGLCMRSCAARESGARPATSPLLLSVHNRRGPASLLCGAGLAHCTRGCAPPDARAAAGRPGERAAAQAASARTTGAGRPRPRVAGSGCGRGGVRVRPRRQLDLARGRRRGARGARLRPAQRRRRRAQDGLQVLQARLACALRSGSSAGVRLGSTPGTAVCRSGCPSPGLPVRAPNR